MIIVHITEKMLKDARACDDGLALWREMATDETWWDYWAAQKFADDIEKGEWRK